jgi:nifR3 family TIM-barrel protein
MMNIGNLELENKLILAPLANMLRLSLRLTYRKLGAAMTCVGVIDAKAVAESKGEKIINLLGREETTNEEERPVSIQLIGSEISEVVEAAKRIEKFASIIDLNFSGPINRVIDKGQGAACLRNPGLITEMVGAVVENVSVPVTAKIRIGIQGDDVDVLRIAKGCEAAGASALIVHARTVSERYAGQVHWEWIKRVKENVSIPVVGNGGVNSPFDAKAMLETTGCDFVMIGTSAIINPLIFYQTNQYLQTGTFTEMNETLALLKFFREYRVFARRIDSRGPLRFLKRSCGVFMKMRSFIKKIKAGTVTME